METVKYLGKLENARFLHVGLFQGITNKPKAILSMEMKASNNPALQIVKYDPTIFCTAYKKNRFYLFTKREPEDIKGYAEFIFYFLILKLTIKKKVVTYLVIFFLNLTIIR